MPSYFDLIGIVAPVFMMVAVGMILRRIRLRPLSGADR
jgi:hypothetical protein